MADVDLGYASTVVLRVRTLRVARGESWFVLGPNGSGKTTLLRALIGLLDPLRGRVERDEACKLAHIGFVPQRCECRTILPTTLREFVSLGLVGHRATRREREIRVQRVLDGVGLMNRAGADYRSLSGGQRQRALLARALIRDPVLLVLDEPTNGLDPDAEESLLEILERLRRERHLTALFVTHDVALAARHASHVALVFDRELAAGTRDELLTAFHLRKIFGIDPLEGGR